MKTSLWGTISTLLVIGMVSCKKDNTNHPEAAAAFENTKWHLFFETRIDTSTGKTLYIPYGDSNNFDKTDYLMWRSDHIYISSTSDNRVDSGTWTSYTDSSVDMLQFGTPVSLPLGGHIIKRQLTSNRFIAFGSYPPYISLYRLAKIDN